MFEIRPLTDLPATQINRFLASQFAPAKAAFLAQHGDWWHKGRNNRFAVVDAQTGAIAAYFNTTPTAIVAGDRTHPTIWWSDLIVDRNYRRRGLQTLMDDSVRGREGLKLGFPNAFHAQILERHGWAIRRDSCKYLLPLLPHRLHSVRTARGVKGRILRLSARLLALPALLLRNRLAGYRPKRARVLLKPTPQQLASVFERFAPQSLLTTARTKAHLRWRYFDCPYFDELAFYGSGEPLTHYAIVRRARGDGAELCRILDLYGDLTDGRHIRDLLLLIARDAVQSGAEQVTVMASQSAPDGLRAAMRRSGFWLSLPIYFCHHAEDVQLMQRLRTIPSYWTLGDSDNDDPLLAAT